MNILIFFNIFINSLCINNIFKIITYFTWFPFFKSSHIIRLNVNVNKKIVSDYQNSNDLLSEICSNLPIDFLAYRNDTAYVQLLIFVFTN